MATLSPSNPINYSEHHDSISAVDFIGIAINLHRLKAINPTWKGNQMLTANKVSVYRLYYILL